jgi:hypothetical protein
MIEEGLLGALCEEGLTARSVTIPRRVLINRLLRHRQCEVNRSAVSANEHVSGSRRSQVNAVRRFGCVSFPGDAEGAQVFRRAPKLFEQIRRSLPAEGRIRVNGGVVPGHRLYRS